MCSAWRNRTSIDSGVAGRSALRLVRMGGRLSTTIWRVLEKKPYLASACSFKGGSILWLNTIIPALLYLKRRCRYRLANKFLEDKAVMSISFNLVSPSLQGNWFAIVQLKPLPKPMPQTPESLQDGRNLMASLKTSPRAAHSARHRSQPRKSCLKSTLPYHANLFTAAATPSCRWRLQLMTSRCRL
jgi:hypothetical protein